MIFGNGKDQRTFGHPDNNYCGGFALDAVLTEVISGKTADPEDTYDAIQNMQNTTLASSIVSQNFVAHSKKPSNTAMSLPSSIALTALDKGLDVAVFIHRKKLAGELVTNGSDFILEEEAKLDKQVTVHDVNDIVAEVEKTDATHFIVLTNDAKHWVAVKKESGPAYTCYDPAGAKCTLGNTLINAVGSGRMNSLIIALKK